MAEAGGRSLRSGCYLTHDDGLYHADVTAARIELRPALCACGRRWCSRPEPGLALLTMGRRDVSFDQDLPMPLRADATARVDQAQRPARLSEARRPTERVEVGDWIEFGISHPCTVFDKWQLIPVLDDDDRVVDLIRTFF